MGVNVFTTHHLCGQASAEVEVRGAHAQLHVRCAEKNRNRRGGQRFEGDEVLEV